MVRWNKEKKSSWVEDNKTWSEIKKESISDWAEKPEQWCDYCNNAKTTIPDGDLTKHFNKKFVRFVKNYIDNNNLDNFVCKDIMKGLDIEHISNRTLQNRALVILTSLGFLRKERREIIKKNKNVIPYYTYKRNKIQEIPRCILKNKKGELIHDKNIAWRETKYFGLHSKQY